MVDEPTGVTRSTKLIHVLEESKRLGFLGPGPVGDHIDHARKFLGPIDRRVAELGPELGTDRSLLLADLGAGGGLPSLPLLMERPGITATLIDGSQKRCSFLVWAAGELGVAERVKVWCGRAETIAHEDRARGRFDVVVARGFGPPPLTVECGAPLLTDGGYLIISEPPGGREWPKDALAAIGLSRLDDVAGVGDGVVVLERTGSVEPRYPRRAKEQRRTPLF